MTSHSRLESCCRGSKSRCRKSSAACLVLGSGQLSGCELEHVLYKLRDSVILQLLTNEIFMAIHPSTAEYRLRAAEDCVRYDSEPVRQESRLAYDLKS